MKARNYLKNVQRMKAPSAFVHRCQRPRALGERDAPPDLMELWRFAYGKLVEVGPRGLVADGFRFKGVWLSISSIWDQFGSLHKFVVWRAATGALLLVGDAYGPVHYRTASGAPVHAVAPEATP